MARWDLICFTNTGISSVRMRITSKNSAKVQVQPESYSMHNPLSNEWKTLSTHDTAHLKERRIVSKNPIVYLSSSVASLSGGITGWFSSIMNGCLPSGQILFPGGTGSMPPSCQG